VSMSEVYEAFIDGRMPRGAFIRRLVGFGVSLPVAAAYAAALKPESAYAHGNDGDHDADDLYDLYHHGHHRHHKHHKHHKHHRSG
jgi:hypothetical protein